MLDDGEAAALLETAVDRFLVGLATRDRRSAQVFEAIGEDSFRAVIAGLVRERGRLRLRRDQQAARRRYTGAAAPICLKTG